MAERKRPGDDAAGDRPDDEIRDEVVADEVEDEPVGRGGTAVRERTANSDSPTAKKKDVSGLNSRFTPVGRRSKSFSRSRG